MWFPEGLENTPFNKHYDRYNLIIISLLHMHENKCNRVKSFFPLIKRINGNDKRICQFRIQLSRDFV